MGNRVTWYTLLIFFGFLIALIGMFGLVNMFGASNTKKTNNVSANGSGNLEQSSASRSAQLSEIQPVTKVAISEVKKLTKADESQIKVLKQERTQWPDTSLGCPTKGFAYAQMIVPGYIVVLQVGDEQFEYHTDLNKEVILCDNKQLE